MPGFERTESPGSIQDAGLLQPGFEFGGGLETQDLPEVLAVVE